jgi:hypothetical protein
VAVAQLIFQAQQHWKGLRGQAEAGKVVIFLLMLMLELLIPGAVAVVVVLKHPPLQVLLQEPQAVQVSLFLKQLVKRRKNVSKVLSNVWNQHSNAPASSGC